MKACITWEHGDADFETKAKHKMSKETLDRFLDFMFDQRVWVKGHGKSRGHFADGHNERSDEHFEAINKKYNNEFDDYMEADQRYSYPRASVEDLWIKDGNKKMNIVWEKCLQDNLITLPEIGSIFDHSVGHIDGYGHQTFGGNPNDTLPYQDFEKLALDKGVDGYGKLEGCKIIDIGINFSGRNRYHTEYTSFHYVLLCEYEGMRFTTSMNGYDPKMRPDEKFLYFH